MSKTITFICPWYGQGIPGGSERAVRELVHQLSERGLEVQVFTTCAHDFYDWAAYYPPGQVEESGTKLHRFMPNMRNSSEFDRVNRLLLDGRAISAWDESVFLNNIIASDDLCRCIWRERDGIIPIFTPYMFGTTYWGSRLIPEDSFIIPCLHDEPYSKLPRYRTMLESVRALLFYSEGEARVAKQLVRNNGRERVIGLGLDLPGPVPESARQEFRRRYALEVPYLFLPGRKQPEKNTSLALDYFQQFLQRNPDTPIKLVLSGPGRIEFPEHCSGSFMDLGFIDTSVLACAYACARAVCIPSTRESFSFTMFEAWSHGRPVLVQRDCLATALPVKHCRGGDMFHDAPSFGTALEEILGRSEAEDLDIGRRGYNYTREQCSWDRVIDRFIEAIGHTS
ncbi:glycosyltransferase family 4 protein [bacterium]|nr:glycosyltransferase family 4 protein [bacterium]